MTATLHICIHELIRQSVC